MQYGEYVEDFERMLEDDPDNPPAALLSRPEITMVVAQLVTAFFNLSACRGYGMAPSPITVVDALYYARAAGFCDEMRFLAVIRETDAVFLEWVAKQQTKKHGRHRKTGSKS